MNILQKLIFSLAILISHMLWSADHEVPCFPKYATQVLKQRLMRSINLNSDGTRLVVVPDSGSYIKIVNTLDGQVILESKHVRRDTIGNAFFSPKDNFVVMNIFSGKYFDEHHREQKLYAKYFLFKVVENQLTPHTKIDDARSITFSPDELSVVAVNLDFSIHKYSLVEKKTLTLVGHNDAVGPPVFDASGSRILTYSRDGTAKIWDAQSGDEMLSLRHNDTVVDAAFSPDGQYVATGSFDNTVKIWNATTGVVKHVFTKPDYRKIQDLQFNKGGNVVVANCGDRAYVWDVESGKLIYEYDHNNYFPMFFSPDDTCVVHARRSDFLAEDYQYAKLVFYNFHERRIETEKAVLLEPIIKQIAHCSSPNIMALRYTHYVEILVLRPEELMQQNSLQQRAYARLIKKARQEKKEGCSYQQFIEANQAEKFAQIEWDIFQKFGNDAQYYLRTLLKGRPLDLEDDLAKRLSSTTLEARDSIGDVNAVDSGADDAAGEASTLATRKELGDGGLQ